MVGVILPQADGAAAASPLTGWPRRPVSASSNVTVMLIWFPIVSYCTWSFGPRWHHQETKSCTRRRATLVTMTSSSDLVLLERALIALDAVMGKRDATLGWGVPVGTAAHESATLCLSAAVTLVDVAQALLSEPQHEDQEALMGHWQTIIAHTKNAGRLAHQAALQLAGESHLVTAQGGIIVRQGDPY